MKKKIMFLITKATWGGAQKYVFDLATNLPKQEFDIIVAFGTKGKLTEDLIRAGIKTRVIPSLSRDITFFSDIETFFQLLHTLKELRPDVLHLNSSKAAALGALAARIAGIRKIIFTVHGWPFKESRNPIMRAFIYLASWFTALLSHIVIVVSKIDEELGRNMWGISKKIRYVPLGIAPFEQLSSEEAYNTMFGALSPAKLKPETLRLVTIGELTKNKGIRFAIDAVALLRERGVDTVYVVVSEGEDKDILTQYAEKIGVADRVFFPGFIPDASRKLSGFDVFVLPSLKEGMPNVLLEAAFVGIPIVTTSVIDEEFARKYSNVRLVPPADPTALADAMLEVSIMPRASGRTPFTTAQMVAATRTIYRD